MDKFASDLLASAAWHLMVALSIGLLIGVERERRKGDGAKRAPEGLRTFALIALLGGMSAQTGRVEVIALAGLFAIAAAIVGYGLGDRHDPGLTTEVAFFATFVLGVLAQTQPALALGMGVGVAMLLAAREPLHHFVQSVLTKQELLDGVIFAAAALVILPALPNRPIDPWGVINLFAFWRMVVVLMALSAIGYWSMRVLGPHFGLPAVGFASGFVSSSMGIAAMSSRAQSNSTFSGVAAAGGVASVLGSLIFLVALVSTADAILLWRLLVPIGCAIIPTLGYAIFLTWMAPSSASPTAPSGRAFDMKTVTIFGLLVLVFAFVSTFLESQLGQNGVLLGAAATGLIDAHATAVSIASMIAAGKLDAKLGALAILIGLSANMAIKIPAAFALGPRPFAVKVSLGLAMLLAGLWLGFFADAAFSLSPAHS